MDEVLTTRPVRCIVAIQLVSFIPVGKTLLLSLVGTILHKGMISPQIIQAYAMR